MAANITVTPVRPTVGAPVNIDLSGFLPNTSVDVKVPEYGLDVQGISDPSGEWNGTDLSDHATALLTIAAGQNAIAAETVVIGSITYTFRAAVAATANEVLIGADANATLDNLKAAVNLDTTQASKFGTNTLINPDAGAGARNTTNRTLQFYAKVPGVGGNALASTETMTQGSFAGTTFSGGAASTGVNPLTFTPTDTRPFTVIGTDGTSTVSVKELVYSQ